MDLLAKRNDLMQSLNQVNSNMAALEKQFSEMQVSRERIIGAILVIDELLGAEKGVQAEGEYTIDRGEKLMV